MDKLYYQDQYSKEFIAEILEIKEKGDMYHILLDKTSFFPGGGGQFCDLGMIDSHKVKSVYEEKGKIYHILDRKPIKIHKVKCMIDWSRREDGMHQHFAQHVLSGCFFKKYNLNTVSFHLGKDISTVDIQGMLTHEQIEEVEALANEVIRQDIPLEILTPSKKELKKIWIRRNLPDTQEQIRIVKIGDLDSNACCGIHPKSTSELRMIKIKRWEKNKDATRIEFLAGKRAIDYILKRDKYLSDICKYLRCGEEEAINGIKNIYERLESAISMNRKLEDSVADFEIKELIKNSNKIGNISVVIKTYNNEDIKYVSKVASKISEEKDAVALLGIKNEDKVNLIFSCSSHMNNISMNSLLKDAVTLVDGRGGGSLILAQGGGRNNGNLEVALDYAFKKIEKSI